MKDYERALEIAGTGVGVVFLALVTLTLVTLLLTRYIKEKGSGDEPQDPGTSGGAPEEETSPNQPTDGDDPAAIAAMVAAIQVVRGRVSQAAALATPSSDSPSVGAWRSQGRQALMQSQGVSSTPRTRR